MSTAFNLWTRLDFVTFHFGVNNWLLQSNLFSVFCVHFCNAVKKVMSFHNMNKYNIIEGIGIMSIQINVSLCRFQTSPSQNHTCCRFASNIYVFATFGYLSWIRDLSWGLEFKASESTQLVRHKVFFLPTDLLQLRRPIESKLYRFVIFCIMLKYTKWE